MAAGFTLPAILVVTGALFILAVGVLLVAGIERNTARSFVDRQRAELAARAGLEELRGILNLEAANDDFIILQSALASPITAGREPAPQLFLARGKATASGYAYRYVPLFSTTRLPPENPQLAPPEIEPLVGTNENERIDFATLPYQDKVRAAWLPIQDEQGRTVARYAYWVEDLQGKLDPRLVGQSSGIRANPRPRHLSVSRARPQPGPCGGPMRRRSTRSPCLPSIPPPTLSAKARLAKPSSSNRPLLLSPGSTLAAAHISPPLIRDAATGRLADLTARAAEENLIANLQPYFERPLIPFAPRSTPARRRHPAHQSQRPAGAATG